MKQCRVAVIGVGYLGQFHAEKFSKLPNAELVAVCDADSKRADEIAAKLQVSAYYDYHELIGKVDAVSIVFSRKAPTTIRLHPGSTALASHQNP